MPAETEEAVLIFLDGVGLSDSTYRTSDLDTLESLLIGRLENDKVGALDGHETGPAETVIYIYGAKAEEIFSSIQPVLESYPLCENSRVVVRHGGPGADQRVVSLSDKSKKN